MRLAAVTLLVACSSSPSYDPHPTLPAWMDDARVVVSGHDLDDQMNCRENVCRHNEDVDMTAYAGAFFLVHRTARSQILGPNSALHVLRSSDGKSFDDVATIPAPDDRDLRDPHFFVVGSELHIEAITRVSCSAALDDDCDTITVDTRSTDGVHWTSLANLGPEKWTFWRPKQNGGVFYDAAYDDGDAHVALFSSPDGATWTEGAQIYGADIPSETEIVFMP